MKKTVTIACLFTLKLIASAQIDTSWIKGGFMSLAFNQSSFSQWAAGGENSLALTTTVNLFSNYKKDKTAWDNSLDMAYGMIQYGSQGLRKNEDKFELNSKYGYLIYHNLYLSGLVNMKSQFTRGYEYGKDGSATPVSDFLAPAYLTVALGIDYKPNAYFSLFVSPATGKYTFVNNQDFADQGRYGVDPALTAADGTIIAGTGKRFRAEFGAYIRAKFQKDLLANLNLMSTLVLFNNYTDKQKDNRKNVDVEWQTMLTIKAGKFITTNLFTHVIYDQDIKYKTQFKEIFGIGISYRF